MRDIFGLSLALAPQARATVERELYPALQRYFGQHFREKFAAQPAEVAASETPEEVAAVIEMLGSKLSSEATVRACLEDSNPGRLDEIREALHWLAEWMAKQSETACFLLAQNVRDAALTLVDSTPSTEPLAIEK